MNRRVKNTLGGRATSKGLSAMMKPGIILALVLISVFSLAALVTLSGFADDLRDQDNGKAHALSNSAIGYAGIVTLLRAEDKTVALDRTDIDSPALPTDLHILTLSRPSQMPDLEDIDASQPTLIVLPKWMVSPAPERKGWVAQTPKPYGPVYRESAQNAGLEKISKSLNLSSLRTDDGTHTYDIASIYPAIPSIKNINIRYLQTLESEDAQAILSIDNKIVLARITETNFYILSDPDLINTQGISQRSRARYAVDLIEGLTVIADNEHTLDSVSFDLSLHGFARAQNLVKTLLTPPFLAATLCLLAAGALVGWQAFTRFGDPLREERDYALGKYTLADNGARFIKLADKELGMAESYINLTRRLTAKDFYLEKQSQSNIDEFFENREEKTGQKPRWKTITRQLTSAEDSWTYLRAAKALYKWRQEISDERK